MKRYVMLDTNVFINVLKRQRGKGYNNKDFSYSEVYELAWFKCCCLLFGLNLINEYSNILKKEGISPKHTIQSIKSKWEMKDKIELIKDINQKEIDKLKNKRPYSKFTEDIPHLYGLSKFKSTHRDDVVIFVTGEGNIIENGGIIERDLKVKIKSPSEFISMLKTNQKNCEKSSPPLI